MNLLPFTLQGAQAAAGYVCAQAPKQQDHNRPQEPGTHAQIDRQGQFFLSRSPPDFLPWAAPSPLTVLLSATLEPDGTQRYNSDSIDRQPFP